MAMLFVVEATMHPLASFCLPPVTVPMIGALSLVHEVITGLLLRVLTTNIIRGIYPSIRVVTLRIVAIMGLGGLFVLSEGLTISEHRERIRFFDSSILHRLRATAQGGGSRTSRSIGL